MTGLLFVRILLILQLGLVFALARDLAVELTSFHALRARLRIDVGGEGRCGRRLVQPSHMLLLTHAMAKHVCWMLLLPFALQTTP